MSSKLLVRVLRLLLLFIVVVGVVVYVDDSLGFFSKRGGGKGLE